MDMLRRADRTPDGATSQFGVEFDSLADVVSFCVAPAFLLYTTALSSWSSGVARRLPVRDLRGAAARAV